MSLHLLRNKRIFLSVFVVIVVVTPAVFFAISRLQAAEDTSAAVSCNPSAKKIDAAVCLQDMNDKVKKSMVVEKQYTLKDSRDGRKYYISKLKDGNVWMTQNLGLGTKDKTVALTPDDTDIKPSNNFRTLPKAMSDKCTKKDNTSSWGNYFYDCKKMYSVANLKHYYQGFTLKTTGTRHQNLGNEYNRYTATAGTTGVAADEIRERVLKEHRGQNALDSICPAGWYLPTAAKYKTLMNTYVDMSVINDPQYRYTRDPHLEAQLNKLINAPIYLAPKEGGDYLENNNGNNDSGYLTSTNFKVFQLSTTVGIRPESDIPENGRPWPDEWNSGFVRCIARADATYTVHYNVNGGTGKIADSTKNSSHKQTNITLTKTVPTRKGYAFVGWAKTATATSAKYAKGASITLTSKEKTLYAVWQKLPTYELKFNLNGGTGSVTTQKCTTTTLTGSCNVSIPNVVPTKSGMIFLGWADTADATTAKYERNSKAALSASKTVYAIYAVGHKLSYDANGGSNAPVAKDCYASSASEACSLNVTSDKPTRAHYKFVGWAESADADEATIQPGVKIDIATDKKLYAVWECLTYVNTYVDGVGGKISEPMQVSAGTEVTVIFTPDAGYEVASVNAPNVDMSNLVDNKLTFTVGDEDVNITVAFATKTDQGEVDTATYTLRFDLNNGTGEIPEQSCEATADCEIPNSEPTRSGYHFLGWADSKYATKADKQAGSKIRLSADKTFYAIWAPIYTLKLNLNYGNGSETNSDSCYPATVGGTCEVNITSASPSRNGYRFLGWSESEFAETATYAAGKKLELSASKILYAVWEDSEIEKGSGTGKLTWWQGQEYVKSSENTLPMIVRIDYPMEKFSELLIDQQVVSPDNYEVDEGSTIIVVESDFVKTLADGMHALQVKYNDGLEVSTEFSVAGEKEESDDDWSEDDGTKSRYIEYDSIPEGFSDQNFYNCVANEFTEEFPDETIAETGLSDSQLAKIRKLSCSGAEKDDDKKIVNTVGLEKLTSLTQLSLDNNLITEINVSNNKLLTNLDLEGNQIQAIDLIGNSDLASLNVGSNQLHELNVSGNVELTELDASNNHIDEFAVSSNVNLKSLDLSGNNLATIDVTQNTLLEYLNLAANSDTSYHRLSEINVGSNSNLLWLNVIGNNIESINLENNKSLISLMISGNTIENIDLSQNKELETLLADNNSIKEINLEKNTKLEELDVSNNGLQEINISNNKGLKILRASGNELSVLDVKENTLLEELGAVKNSLSKIDLSKNDKLVSLNLSENKIKSLDLSNNTALETVNVSENLLTSLDVTKNDVLNELLADNIIIKAGAKATTRNGEAVEFDMSSVKFLNFETQTVDDTDDYTFNRETGILLVKKFDEEGTFVQVSSERDYETYKLQLTIKNENDDVISVPDTGDITEEGDSASGHNGALTVLGVILVVGVSTYLLVIKQRRKTHIRFDR